MEAFFNPRSVVLIGVSRESGPGAYNNLETMTRFGYSGRIRVVHPKAVEILGHPVAASVGDLDEVPELAVISVGRERVLPAVGDCLEKGVRRFVVISQGFADADERGKELQRELVEATRRYGARVVGPNTMGVLDSFDGFSTAFIDLPRDPSPPRISLVVQSGVFQVGLESFTEHAGKAIDIGNGCDVDFTDLLEYFEKDPLTDLIVLHMEGMMRGRKFLETAARVGRCKPVVVFKTGRSAAGARAALSHTGSLVGEDELFEEAFAEAGIVRVRGMVELQAVTRAFRSFNPMAGPRLGVVTATGACGIMTADACEDHGLELASFPESIREGLENERIAWHRLGNPVDIWPLGMVTGSFVDVLKRSSTGLLDGEGVDGLLLIAPVMASPLHRDLELEKALREIQGRNLERKPVAVWIYGDGAKAYEPVLNEIPGVACFSTIDEAVMGLGATWRYERWRRKKTPGDRFRMPEPSPSHKIALPDEGPVVDARAFDLLRHYGIPVAEGETVLHEDDAARVARRTGYPVVLKIVSPQWLHKSDQGGVRVGIGDEKTLREAFEELQALFESRTPDGLLQGFLVQKQVEGVEILVGIKRDPQFGPVLAAGMGGVYTEVLRDVARRLLPVGFEDALEMLESLRMAPLLKGVRGRQPVDLAALARLMEALSRLAADHPRLAEMDLNPVLAGPRGCWCADCRMIMG